jgi:hypothetical protein
MTDRPAPPSPHIALVPGSHGYSWGVYTDRSMKQLIAVTSALARVSRVGPWRKRCDVFFGDAKPT